ncbi:MAG: helical backbone metal receptor [Sulfurimonas sp.]|nr:helical backbone metal receptor [Sulfurimonas sp.]
MGIKTFLITLFFILNLSANERIISLSPSITEIIYALDKGDTLVATSSYSLYPKKAQSLPVIGGYENPHIEKILSHKPSLVVGQSFNASTLQKLKHFGIKTLMLDLKSIDSIKNSILILDKKIPGSSPRMTQNGHSQLLPQEYDNWESTKLIKNIDLAIKNIKKTKKSHSVMIVYGLRSDLRSGIYIASKSIFFNEIIDKCGGYNTYASNSTTQPVLNYENVIALNPEIIIILHSHATESNVDIDEALNAWKKIPTIASKTNKIHIIDDNYLHIPSHRIALTIKRICGVIND